MTKPPPTSCSKNKKMRDSSTDMFGSSQRPPMPRFAATYLPFFAAKFVLLSRIFLFFEQEDGGGFVISHSIPSSCPFHLWNPYRVHLNGNGSVSQGGFATLGCVMESLRDSANDLHCAPLQTPDSRLKTPASSLKPQVSSLSGLVAAPLLQVNPCLSVVE